MQSMSQLPPPPSTSVMSKPVFGGGTKSTLPASIIKPGKYKPKKFQMDMPDEKQSGIYGLQNNMNDDDDNVESMALDENIRSKPSLNAAPSISALGGMKV